MNSLFKIVTVLLTVFCACLILLVHTDASAQDEKTNLSLKSSTPIILPAQDEKGQPVKIIQRYLFQRDKKPVTSHLVWRDRKFSLVFPDKKQLDLPYILDTLVSLNGNVIVQFGDKNRFGHPLRTDIYWLDSNGKEVGSDDGFFSGGAVVSISDDGYTAVSGTSLKNPDMTYISLYRPDGKKVWSREIEQGNRVSNVFVSSGGDNVISIVTDSKALLKNHRIWTRGKNGDTKMVFSGAGILQKIVLLDSGTKAFVQGRGTYGLADFVEGKGSWKWKQKGKVRMISPYGAALSPDGKTLFLLLVDMVQIKKGTDGTYSWKILALNADTGERIFEETLPGKYPSTWSRVFEQVSNTEIVILTGQDRLVHQWGTSQ